MKKKIKESHGLHDKVSGQKNKKESVFDKIDNILQGKISNPHVDWKKEKADHIIKKYLKKI